MYVYGGGGCKAKSEARKIWLEVVTNDTEGLGLAGADALDLLWWMRKIMESSC